MILQNITTAIREQNYYAVALEFVIVIAGVVIGFQINAWNEARAARETERTYLIRLHHDMVRSTCALRSDEAAMSSWHTSARRTLDALLENSPDAVGDTGFELIASTRVRTGSVFRATLNELVNGGQMNLIADDALRARIAETAAQFEARNQLIDVLVSSQSSFIPAVQNRLRPVPGETYMITYDFDALAADDAFINALGSALRVTHYNTVLLAQMVEIADTLRLDLAPRVGESVAPLVCPPSGAAS